MDIKKIDTGTIDIGIWKVSIKEGWGIITDQSGAVSAEFTVESAEQITLVKGEAKFADMALIALRSYLRYGISCD